MKLFKRIIIVIIVTLIFGVIGLVSGTIIGDATSLTFMGKGGYEGGGLLFTPIGLITGFFVGLKVKSIT